jgi:hypothetical protein
MWRSLAGSVSRERGPAVAREKRRRATREERERRLSEITELLAARATPSAVVRFSVEKWGISRRAAQKYVAAARDRLAEGAGVDRRQELGLVIASYRMIFRRQLSANELSGARTTLDHLVALLGLALPKSEVITPAMVQREIERLEAEIALAERERRS